MALSIRALVRAIERGDRPAGGIWHQRLRQVMRPVYADSRGRLDRAARQTRLHLSWRQPQHRHGHGAIQLDQPCGYANMRMTQL